MSYYMKFFLFILVINLSARISFCQNKDSLNIGSITGVLRDSIHNFYLQSATIAIYKVSDGSLIKYQLSDGFGKFTLKQIPVGIKLHIVANYIGYTPVSKEVLIPNKSAEIDLKTLNMEPKNVMLNEVTILDTPPPMQLHGDTIEFNADAFKLDTNAVVGDMLRKLSGVTVWNDGLITVNGKPITKLLVEGKEFFGGNNRVALQNLAKNAVKKIQVYEDKNDVDPINPKTEMNIVLKKSKKSGYFGKLGAGYGTHKRNDVNGMINYFSPKDQISLVGITNNINKSADGVSQLISVNSFKGSGIDNDYNSDFTKQGQNIFRALGASAMHNFGKNDDLKTDTNQLKAEVFISNDIRDINIKNNTLVTLDSGKNIQQSSTSIEKSSYKKQSFNFDYKKNFNRNLFVAKSYYQNIGSLVNTTQTNNSLDNTSMDKSEGSDQQNSSDNRDIFGGTLKYSTQRFTDFAVNRSKSVDMDLYYSFKLNNGHQDILRNINFSAADTTQNRLLNRSYSLTQKNFENTLSGNFNNILNLLNIANPFFNIDVKNTITLIDNKENNFINDYLNDHQKVINQNLTNLSHYQVTDYKPGINFLKTITNSLANRYIQGWRFQLFAQGELYTQKNTSEKYFQNFEKSYYYFIPSASISHYNYQFGQSRKTYILNYNTSVIYPTVTQLAPLNDDANVYITRYGNINLRPSYKHDLSFDYGYTNTEAKNTFLGYLNLNVGIIRDFITDSISYDKLGRIQSYSVNTASNKYASLNGRFQKSYKIKENLLQIIGKMGLGYSNYPSSLNGVSFLSKNQSFSHMAEIVYSYKDILNVKIGEDYSKSLTYQVDFSKYSFSNLKIYTNLAYTMPSGIFLNSSLNLNKNQSSFTGLNYFSIWNADLGLRFLKGANAEIKFSALDLLHQNKSVFNYVTGNSLTSGTVNVLQQYYMITIAYYPRKFGLNKK